MAPVLRILKPGLLTTVQDLGRIGYQSLGVAVSGALDPVSLCEANALVGNVPNTGALEVAYLGPTFVVEAESVRLACTGAQACIEILPDERALCGTRVPARQSFHAHRGQVVRIGAISGSAVLYIAVEGGFAIDPVLGSVSTYVRGGMGGWHGRALVAGDALPLRLGRSASFTNYRLDDSGATPQSHYRVILGPQHTAFTKLAIQAFLDGEYVVGPASDRMAMHLAGPVLDHTAGHDIVSDGIAAGSIQVPGHGQPLILMADRQTTGGYPKIATVISADLPALGRARIGDRIAFEAVTVEQAQELRGQLLQKLAAIPKRLVATGQDSDELTRQLLTANLISGAVSAHAP